MVAHPSILSAKKVILNTPDVDPLFLSLKVCLLCCCCCCCCCCCRCRCRCRCRRHCFFFFSPVPKKPAPKKQNNTACLFVGDFVGTERRNGSFLGAIISRPCAEEVARRSGNKWCWPWGAALTDPDWNYLDCVFFSPCPTRVELEKRWVKLENLAFGTWRMKHLLKSKILFQTSIF